MKTVKHMKKNSIYSLVIAVLVVVFSSCDSETKTDSTKDTAIVVSPNTNSNAGEANSMPLTKIEFAESSFDFGKIDEGKKVEHVFTFKNTGENPLVLQDARASCGCTIPEYTKDTIAPGQEGKLNVIYDSNNKEGKIEKSVTVTANTDPKTTDLKISAFVIKKIDGPFTK